MTRLLPRNVPLAELHTHLGSAVTPSIMWGIAHAQGIRAALQDAAELFQRGYFDFVRWLGLFVGAREVVHDAALDVGVGAIGRIGPAEQVASETVSV